MFCPECRSEYREGFTTCADCEVALVPELPPEDHEGEALVTVLDDGDPGRLALAHSLLDDAGISHIVAGEGLQDLFGLGRLGAGFNVITGPAHIQVPESRAEEARELLEELEFAEPSAMLDEEEITAARTPPTAERKRADDRRGMILSHP